MEGEGTKTKTFEAYLEFISPEGKTGTTKLDQSKLELTIGRGEGSDIPILVSDVSRKHAVLVKLVENYSIRDVGSSYGTFVNEQNIKEMEMPPILNEGDQVRLGKYVIFIYHINHFKNQ